MSLKDIQSNRGIAEALQHLMASGRLIHALLLYGGSDEDRTELGKALAKALLCDESSDDSCEGCISCRTFDSGNHPDFLHVYKEEGKASISTEAISRLQSQLQLKPLGNRYAVLIDNAESLTVQAQNKLLKTLEEPKGEVVIILLAQQLDSMLETIRSRCSTFCLKDPEYTEGSFKAEALEFIDLAQKDSNYYELKAALACVLDAKDEQRDKALEFLSSVTGCVMEKIRTNPRAELVHIADESEKASAFLKQGHNTAYTLKQMCLSIQMRR